tara:strand:- start:52 stop:372 length:321 start_codon:yes stop_codon:yes gene_type:complete
VGAGRHLLLLLDDGRGLLLDRRAKFVDACVSRGRGDVGGRRASVALRWHLDNGKGRRAAPSSGWTIFLAFLALSRFFLRLRFSFWALRAAFLTVFDISSLPSANFL